MVDQGFRTERDSMGEVKVPEDAYYGAQTLRAIENFPISGIAFPAQFIHALALIKFAAASANEQLGLLEPGIAAAIRQAAQEVSDGKFDREFVVDIFQTGSGTSTSMNANEVIADRALEILDKSKGSREIGKTMLDHFSAARSVGDDSIDTLVRECFHYIGAKLNRLEQAQAQERHHGVEFEIWQPDNPFGK